MELEQRRPEVQSQDGESSYADTMARITSSVPAESTSFVGRRLELHKVKQLLSKYRSLVLTGPAGVGKTRLAKQAATTVERAWRSSGLCGRHFCCSGWVVLLAALFGVSPMI
ncbi:ATP-binding protein [Rhodococcus opacus]|nr:ATP-binding protein [Rhodococcus opacus]